MSLLTEFWCPACKKIITNDEVRRMLTVPYPYHKGEKCVWNGGKMNGPIDYTTVLNKFGYFENNFFNLGSCLCYSDTKEYIQQEPGRTPYL